jgi:hypothetical protein
MTVKHPPGAGETPFRPARRDPTFGPIACQTRIGAFVPDEH